MPNQLSKSKRRQSIAEHVAVLSAIAAIAHLEEKPIVAVLREAIREVVRKRAAQPAYGDLLRSAVWNVAPRVPTNIRSHVQAARFKREQREFDRLILDLELASPTEIEVRNSVARPEQAIRVVGFNRPHDAF
jgi:hypothetical protein